jgi:hypothetical protein
MVIFAVIFWVIQMGFFFSIISRYSIPHLIKSKTHQTLIKTSIPLLFSSASLSNTIHRKKFLMQVTQLDGPALT